MSGVNEYQCVLEELHRLKKANDTLVGIIENQSTIMARQEALIKTLLTAIEGLNKFETSGK
ncbi:MAG: hypothetical protein EBV30_10770 [Actinobacteria bacterium]|nr:hypothetical protein [Actinomycetota bacterium]